MDKYRFKATGLIVETFEKNDIKFEVEETSSMEIVCAKFYIDGGPSVSERFISHDDGNDVDVRVTRLICKVPEAKRSRVLKACNTLNYKIRHLKFVLDDDGDVNVEYDFPENTPDSGIGEMAVEIFARTMIALDNEFGVLMKAIYCEDDALHDKDLMEKLARLCRAHLAAENDETDNETEPEDDETDNEPEPEEYVDIEPEEEASSENIAG